MALQNLETFALVAKYLCFSRAAEMLDCNTSTVSRRVRHLEDEIGALLVSCRAKKIELTPQGEQFLPEAERLIREYKSSIAALQDKENNLSGDVVIGMHQPMASMLSDLVLIKLKKDHPELNIKLISLPPRYMSGMEGCDITIIPAVPDDDTLIARPIVESKLFFCASPTYLEQNGVPKDPKDLASHQLIECQYQGVEPNLWKWRNSDGEYDELRVKPDITVDSNLSAKQWMQAGLGITRLPAITLSRIPQNKVRILFGGQYFLPLNIYAVYRSRRYLPYRVRFVLEQFEQALEQAKNMALIH